MTTRAADRRTAAGPAELRQGGARGTRASDAGARAEPVAGVAGERLLPAVPAAQARPSALAGELRVAIGRSARRIRSERGEADLSEAQFCVLAALTAVGPMTPGALAEREHVKPPSMTRTVNSLVGLGLVVKTDHPTDGRQVTVALTPAGEAEVRETRRRRDAWLTRRLATLTTDERVVLVRAAELLRRIAAQ